MTNLALAALLALSTAAAFAQSEPSEDARPAVHEHKGGTLIVFRVSGAYAPDAFWYEGPKGRYLLRDAELYALGVDNDAEQVRYRIYNMRREGIEYRSSSADRSPFIKRWDDPATVAVVESIIHMIDRKEPAAKECAVRGAALTGTAARHEARRKALAHVASWHPSDVKDPAKTVELEGEIGAARVALELGKEKCGLGTPQGYRAAHVAFDAADRTLVQVANVLDWLPK